jgi:hypothetical protein
MLDRFSLHGLPVDILLTTSRLAAGPENVGFAS